MYESSNPFDKDYKSQMKDAPGKKAGFTSKKTSTGTVYSREPSRDDHAGEDTMKGSVRKGISFRKWNKKKVSEETVQEASAFDKDYKSQMQDEPGKKAGFTSKKTSTGTVYNRIPSRDDHAGADTMKGSVRKGISFRKWNKKAKVAEEAQFELSDAEAMDLIKQAFDALSEQGLELAEQMIEEGNDAALEELIVAALDHIDEGRDWEAAEWHSQMADKKPTTISKKHHVVDRSTGKKFSTHTTESDAVKAWMKLGKKSGAKIVSEEVIEYDLIQGFDELDDEEVEAMFEEIQREIGDE